MQLKWNRTFGRVLTSLAVIFGTSSLSAYEVNNQQQQQAKKPMSKDKPASNFAFAYPKDLNLTDPYDLNAHVEGLAFQAMESGTSFLIKTNSTAATPGLTFHDATVGGFSGNDSNWDYSFGLRAGFGANIDHDAWNVDGTWTWINLTDSQDFTASSGQTLIPTWFPLDTFGAPALPHSADGQSARGTWQCIMNVFDATMGKAYHISRQVVFNPHFGFRFAWLNQHLSAHYAGTGIVSNPTNIFHGKNDFWGVGVRIGVDTDWCLGCGFKFFANAASSVLSGKFKTRDRFTLPVVDSGPQQITDDFHMNVPSLDLAVGLDWGTYLFSHKYYLDFRAGYEFQVWWDQLNVRKLYSTPVDGALNDTVSRGMLSLNGFTFKIQLDL